MTTYTQEYLNHQEKIKAEEIKFASNPSRKAAEKLNDMRNISKHVSKIYVNNDLTMAEQNMVNVMEDIRKKF